MTKVYMDFYYNGFHKDDEEMGEEEERDQMEDAEENKKDSPCLMMYDMRTRAMASWVMSSKSIVVGSGNEWIPKAIEGELQQWGYANRKVILCSDGENAILTVKSQVIDLRSAETVPIESPVGEHDANLAEGAIRRVRE